MFADVLILLSNASIAYNQNLMLDTGINIATYYFSPQKVDLSKTTIILASFLKMNHYTKRLKTHAKNHRA